MPSQTLGGNRFMVDADPLANVAQLMEQLAADTSARAQVLARTTTLSIPDSVYTTVPMTTIVSDVYAQSVLVGANRTAKLMESGLYMLGARVTWPTNTVGMRGLRFMVAGTDYLAQQVAPANGFTVMNANFPVWVAAGSAVDLQVYQGSGGALSIQTFATIWAYRLQRNG